MGPNDRVTMRGDRVKRLREGYEYSQGQLALQSGVDRSLISRIERGIRPNVYVETAGALARALNTTTDYLVGLSSNPFPSHQSPEPATDLEHALLERFRKLTGEQQRLALAQVDLLLEYGQPEARRTPHHE